MASQLQPLARSSAARRSRGCDVLVFLSPPSPLRRGPIRHSGFVIPWSLEIGGTLGIAPEAARGDSDRKTPRACIVAFISHPPSFLPVRRLTSFAGPSRLPSAAAAP